MPPVAIHVHAHVHGKYVHMYMYMENMYVCSHLFHSMYTMCIPVCHCTYNDKGSMLATLYVQCETLIRDNSGNTRPPVSLIILLL